MLLPAALPSLSSGALCLFHEKHLLHPRSGSNILPRSYPPIKINFSSTSFNPKITDQLMADSVSFAAEPIQFLSLHAVLNGILLALKRFSLGPLSFLRSYLLFFPRPSMIRDQQVVNCAGRDTILSGEEIEVAMCMVGLRCSHEDEQLNVGIWSLFEEKEPSLEEVKAAFCVFDENNDGFIDAVELQIVLLKLGFVQGLELGACKMMVSIYDEDRDGRIGFAEFVKLMEISLC